MPVLIGGGGEQKTLRLVAEHADIWHGFGDPETIKHKHEVLDKRCAEIGRDPGEIERSCGVSGDPSDGQQACTPRHHALHDQIGGPDYDLAPLNDWLAWRDETNKK